MIVEEVDKLIMIVYQVIVNVVKFVWAGESQGRAASLPAALVPHLAERREKAAMVAEVRLFFRILSNLCTAFWLDWSVFRDHAGIFQTLFQSFCNGAQVQKFFFFIDNESNLEVGTCGYCNNQNHNQNNNQNIIKTRRRDLWILWLF